MIRWLIYSNVQRTGRWTYLCFTILIATAGMVLLATTTAETSVETARGQQHASLVRDINVARAGSGPDHLTVLGQRVYFAADDQKHGPELWSSDGSAEGTTLVKDIVSGTVGVDPRNLAAVSNTLFFAGNDGVPGLWASDGTTTGTVHLRSFPTQYESYPDEIVSVRGMAYFSVNDQELGGLWRSDGRPAGTQRVMAFSPGARSTPRYLTPFRGNLLFAADGGVWTSDGTVSGTILLVQLDHIAELALAGETAYFSGYQEEKMGLWKSDGTADGTSFVKQFAHLPVDLTEFQGAVFFSLVDYPRLGLWRSEGTAENTVQLMDDDFEPHELAVVSDTLFVSAMQNGIAGLWRSNGAPGGTALVVKTNPYYGGPSTPRALTAVSETLYFTAYDGELHNALWTSDGTVDGTMLLRSYPSFYSNYPSNLTRLKDRLLFAADDTPDGGFRNEELWSSNGTSIGTRLVKEINEATASSSPRALRNLNGTLLFGVSLGYEESLWKSDGSAPGTTSIYSPTAYDEPASVDGKLFFADNNRLLVSDGSPTGTHIIKTVPAAPLSSGITEIASGGDSLYFIAGVRSRAGPYQLWRSDGSSQGTSLVADFYDLKSGTIRELTGFGDAMYLTSGDGVWRSEDQNLAVVQIHSGVSGFIDQLVVSGKWLYLLESGRDGYQALWKSDGTSDGTSLLQVLSGQGSHKSVGEMIDVHGRLFFSLADSLAGQQLWTSDGTTAGTMPLLSFAEVNCLSRFGNMLLLAADDGQHGLELWKSDGTVAGTEMVRDINPGMASSRPCGMTVVIGDAYLAADDGQHGRELWVSDGTSAGTHLVSDINEGAWHSSPAEFVYIRPRLYFAATHITVGRELWQLAIEANTEIFVPVVAR